jgi:hypothetical protein
MGPALLLAAGLSMGEELCAPLLDARRRAEADGRLNFAAVVEMEISGDATAHVWMGSAHTVGRIRFSGHRSLNESTLRRALGLRERDIFDVAAFRKGLTRLNATGMFDPLSLADVAVDINADGVSADVTIPLRERAKRRWSVTGPLIPGFASLQASIATRLPPWGRGIFEAATYYLSLNLVGLALVLERPLLPGQIWLSGFALSPSLSAKSMLEHYGRAHAGHAIRAVLSHDPDGVLVVPLMTTDGDALLVCEPRKPRLWRLRRGAMVAADLALRWLPLAP